MKRFGLYFWVKEAAKLQLEEPEICNLKIVFFLTKKTQTKTTFGQNS